jgi:hypothetical protein
MNAKDLEKLCYYFECNDASLEAQQEAAAELRRLHEVNQELLEALRFIAGHDLSETSDRAKGLIADFIVNRAQKAINKATGEQA